MLILTGISRGENDFSALCLDSSKRCYDEGYRFNVFSDGVNMELGIEDIEESIINNEFFQSISYEDYRFVSVWSHRAVDLFNCIEFVATVDINDFLQDLHNVPDTYYAFSKYAHNVSPDNYYIRSFSFDRMDKSLDSVCIVSRYLVNLFLARNCYLSASRFDGWFRAGNIVDCLLLNKDCAFWFDDKFAVIRGTDDKDWGNTVYLYKYKPKLLLEVFM